MRVRAKILSALLSISLVFGSVNPAVLAAEQQTNDGIEIASETAEDTEISSEPETASVIQSEDETETEAESDIEDQTEAETEADSEITTEFSTEIAMETESDTKSDSSLRKERNDGSYFETKNGVTTTVDVPKETSDTIDDFVNEDAVQLAPPTNLHFDDNFNMCFTGVEECKGHYYYELYKDDELFKSGSWSVGNNTDVRLSTSRDINASGTYKFRVYSQNRYDPENLIDSDWTDYSEAKTYVRPDQALGTTIAKWDPTEIGRYTYESVEGAGGYVRMKYIDRKDGRGIVSAGSIWSINTNTHEEAGIQHTETIDITSDGIYYISIIALSPDITTIANGEEGPMSSGLDTENVSGNVNNVIDSAIENADTADEAVNAISEGADMSALQVAMQTDDTVLDKIEELEKRYQSENSVSVGENQVSEEAGQYVDANDISMIGAAFNAAENETISLDISVPETKIDVDTNRYADSVQLDLKLVSDSEEIHELRLPITITMPIPAGLDSVHLTILHYKNDGSTPEVVEYRVNDDRTITFTVTSFSDFVFAVEKQASEHEIDIADAENGQVRCEVDGAEARIVKSGETVTIIAEPDTGYTVDKITVTTNDDSKEQIAVDLENRTFVMPDQDVIVKATFKALDITSINIRTNPTKIAYFAGEKFDPSGLEIDIIYSDNSTETVKYTEENRVKFNFGAYADKALTLEDTEVELTYNGKTAKIKITVLTEENNKVLKLSVSDITITYCETYNVSCTVTNAIGESVSLESDQIKYKYFGSSDNELSSAPVDAGEYSVQAVFDGNDTYNASISEKAKLTINKKTVTVSVVPAKTTAEPGEEISYEIKAEGFVGSDTFTKQPEVSIIEGSAEVEGTYKLQASGAEAGNNYTIIYASPVTITVKSSEDPEEKARPKIDEQCVAFPKNAVAYSAVYTGEQICPVMTVKYTYTENGKAKKVTLKLNQDYIVTYSNNVNVGTASVTVRGIGEYAGMVKKEFKITQKSIAKVTVSNVGDIIYGQTPLVTVMDGNHELIQGKDFSIEYDKGKESTDTVSTITVKALADGNYTGVANKKIKFNILASNTTAESIANAKITFKAPKDYTYSGKAIKPSVTVTLNNQKLSSGKYKLIYVNNINAGTASVYAVGITKKGKGYYGVTSPATFKINPADFSKSTVKGSTVFPINCNVKNLDITLKDGKNILTKDVDYTIDFSSVADSSGKLKSDIVAGKKYEVLIKANSNGNFMNNSTKSVKISFTKLNLASKTANVTSKLYEVKDTKNFKLDVTYNGIKLVQGTDFTATLKYSKSTDTYTATIKATQNSIFKGSRTIKNLKK